MSPTYEGSIPIPSSNVHNPRFGRTPIFVAVVSNRDYFEIFRDCPCQGIPLVSINDYLVSDKKYI